MGAKRLGKGRVNEAEVPVTTFTKEHKPLRMILDSQVDFPTHVKEAIVKTRRGLIRPLHG